MSALHVSGDVFAHHQEHLTVFTVSVYPSCCRLQTYFLNSMVTQTPGKNSLNECSALRRGPYLHNSQQTQQTNIHDLAIFEPAIPALVRPKTYVLNRWYAYSLYKITTNFKFMPTYYPFPIQFFSQPHTPQLLFVLGGKEVGGLLVIILQI
jgi:hypothetical protein